MQYILPASMIILCVASAGASKRLGIALTILGLFMVAFSNLYNESALEYVAKTYNASFAMAMYSWLDRLHYFGIFIGVGAIISVFNNYSIKKPKKYALAISALVSLCMASYFPIYNWHSGWDSYHGHKLWQNINHWH